MFTGNPINTVLSADVSLISSLCLNMYLYHILFNVTVKDIVFMIFSFVIHTGFDLKKNVQEKQQTNSSML
jgi:hypothetical protein